MRKNKFFVLDFLFLGALIFYLFAGMQLVPFHGDEAMYIRMSKDFDVIFIDHKPLTLLNLNPFDSQLDDYYRTLEGSIPHFIIGLARWVVGIGSDSIPQFPGWRWDKSYEDNIKLGLLPSENLLLVSRLPSVFFLSGSVIVLFLIAKFLGSRRSAYLATLLYSTNPLILSWGRRAVAEAPMLFNGLLSILIAIHIVRLLHKTEKVGIGLWIVYIFVNGFTLASKHTGIVFVITSMLFLFISTYKFNNTKKRLIELGVAIFGCFIFLSPHLWGNPLLGIVETIQLRLVYIRGQVAFLQNGVSLNILDRIMLLNYYPFGASITRYWPNSAVIQNSLDYYIYSFYSGIHWGALGLAVLPISLIGAKIKLVYSAKRENEGLLLVIWLTISIVPLLFNPLNIQRYYIPLVPILAIGVGFFVEYILEYLGNKHRGIPS